MKFAMLAWMACFLSGCGDPVLSLSVRNRSDSTYLIEYRLEGVEATSTVRAEPGVNTPVADASGNYEVHLRVFDLSCRLVAEHQDRIGGLVVDIQPDGSVQWRSPGDLGSEDPVRPTALPSMEACAG